ncbi:alpha/beta hydrolase-fold protein [Bacillus sp. JJ1609]|uniref:alpha/beta hydrolase n=1 Tax=Bacillus sp. JJ1609 TaxID=3122977 RepID=UPI002FFDC13B
MIEKLHINMTSFNVDRLIRVYLPENYKNETESYPVLYMHDGQNVFNDEDAIGGHSIQLEQFLNEKEMKLIVVAIDQNSEERMNEYCPWKNGQYSRKIVGRIDPTGGKGKQYIEFIVNELKPYIDKKYRTLKDQNSMAGISLGGLISTYAACVYPNIFRNVAVLSSAFFRNQEEIEKLLQEADLSQLKKFYLDCGSEEVKTDKMISKEFVNSNNEIYEILRKKDIRVKFNVIEDAEHHYLYFRQRVPEIFKYLCTNDERIRL